MSILRPRNIQTQTQTLLMVAVGCIAFEMYTFQNKYFVKKAVTACLTIWKKDDILVCSAL